MRKELDVVAVNMRSDEYNSTNWHTGVLCYFVIILYSSSVL